MAVAATNSCPISCAHCITRSGPGSNKPTAEFDEAVVRFLEANPFGSIKVSITGGEPFYALDTTRRISDAAKRAGCSVTVVTSAYWAKSDQAATETLLGLPNVDEIVLSYDLYHSQFVPKAFIKSAYLAAKSLKKRVRIKFVQTTNSPIGENNIRNFILEFADEQEIENQLLLNYGRARDLSLKDSASTSPDREYCPSSGPYITGEGTILPCCNSIISIKDDNPLSFGNISDDTSLIRERFLRSIFLASLKIGGAKLLREMLRTIIDDDLDSLSICDLCYMICSSRDVYDQINNTMEDDLYKLELYTFAVVHLGIVELKPLLLDLSDKIREPINGR